MAAELSATMGAMSKEQESGAHSWVAHQGIVTDPAGWHSTGPAEDFVPPTPDERAAAKTSVPRQTPPAPGTGTISISPVGDEWFAIWEYAEEGNPASERSYEGPPGMTREQAIEWALGHAAESIYILDGGKVVPVTRPQAV